MGERPGTGDTLGGSGGGGLLIYRGPGTRSDSGGGLLLSKSSEGAFTTKTRDPKRTMSAAQRRKNVREEGTSTNETPDSELSTLTLTDMVSEYWFPSKARNLKVYSPSSSVVEGKNKCQNGFSDSVDEYRRVSSRFQVPIRSIRYSR